MAALMVIIVIIGMLALVGSAMSLRVLEQFEEGALFQLGRVRGVKKPRLAHIVPIISACTRVAADPHHVEGEGQDQRCGGASRSPLPRSARPQTRSWRTHFALQICNLQTSVEVGLDKNTTVVLRAPLLSTIQEFGAFLTQETKAVEGILSPAPLAKRNGALAASSRQQPN